ncbi:hypothetical protein PARSHIK_76 [Erwinia phage vB_EamM_Parshik]|uniref:Uncharacterized protein n=1 Tax=Erwinia phage vB_EamM_Huxley TaxID=1883373 RepID=A0A1B2ICZ9_9CAUD|nr:hypothetical protein BIZ81_gp208 [Erwinia phage vB_EamM_Huxley]ANZ49157.1 hypothetical protein HUXLEY_75 [Erwinia phage vB_EamM_Huxley]ANZ49985.1 hypothetical protein PARSHIK_76 [Erwinia phage vB_EamM_Parshik]
MQQYFEVPSLDVTIRKAVIDGIVYRLLNESGMDKSDAVFLDSFNTAHQPGSTLGDATDVEYASTDRVYVEVDEERDEMARINRGVGLNIELPFFHDETNGIKAWPIRTKYKVTITFRRNAQSEDELLRWTNRLNSLLDMGRYSLVTESEAYFVIPKPLFNLLNACWVASETRVPAYPTFKEYLAANFEETVGVVANDSGGQQTLMVRYSPTRVEMVYDVNPPAWSKEDNHYEATMTASFEYDRPEEVGCVYPYIINQTPLPDAYFPQIDPPWMENEDGVERSEVQTSFDGTWWQNERRQLIRLPYLLCPPEQLHRVHSPLEAKLLRMFGTDVCFGEENMSNPVVMSTSDLPYEWNPVLLPYIEHCRTIDPTGMTGVFRTELFENGLRIEPRLYHWQDDEFSLTREMDVHKAYFLTESVIYDWRGLDLWPLQKYPKAAELLIKWLFPNLDFPDWWWDLPTLPPSAWEEIEDKTTQDETGAGTNRKHLLLTVFNTTIIAIRGTSNAASEG